MSAYINEGSAAFHIVGPETGHSFADCEARVAFLGKEATLLLDFASRIGHNAHSLQTPLDARQSKLNCFRDFMAENRVMEAEDLRHCAETG